MEAQAQPAITRHEAATNEPLLPSWLDRAAYPFDPKTFATQEGRIRYLDEGPNDPSAKAVLFVHGTPSWSFEWRNVVRALAPTHRCIAPDHLGFGLSDKPRAAALRPWDHARRLQDLVRALDLRDLTLVVHDFGGPIGLPIALDMPERVARVIVINSWLWSNQDDAQVVKLDRVIRSWLGRALYRWLNFSARVLLPAAFGDRKRLTRATHRQYIAPFARREQREAPYALALSLLGSSDFYAELWQRRGALASKPLEIIWGMRDPAFTEQHLARWQAAFPNARIERVPTAGHFVAEEAPEVIARVVKRA